MENGNDANGLGVKCANRLYLSRQCLERAELIKQEGSPISGYRPLLEESVKHLVEAGKLIIEAKLNGNGYQIGEQK